MTAQLKSVEAITMFVADPTRSRVFYEEVFGVEAIHEDADSVAFRFESLIVNLLRETAAPELIEPAPVASRSAGSRFQLTLGVPDVDAACERLQRQGVRVLNGPQDREWGVRTAAFADPDGHVWELAADR